MKKTVITISREYGSGGRTVGILLAEELGINCYDRAVIEKAAEKSGMSPEFIENVEEKAASSFFFNLSQATYSSFTPVLTYDVHPTDKAFFAQAEVIREIASHGSAVIVGRCADYILRDEPDAIHVFLHGDREDRLRRIISEYGIPEQEAREQIKQIDKGRANYYKSYTGGTWGDSRRYDMCINTSRTGISGAVAAIKALVLETRKD
ncbi:MAG TPA: cytidylate kinase-like family protein [Clostridiales bacterium]|jgi:cytidylate kinase|nr:cytidylate kinase-like family protein [Clostridiales bacterium]